MSTFKRRETSSFTRKPWPSDEKGLQEEAADLPIYKCMPNITAALEENQVIVVIGETGSGKTTQVPPLLHEHLVFVRNQRATRQLLACTQPSRIATRASAMRVGQEAGVRIGQEIGYMHEDVNVTSPGTQLLYATDGSLRRLLMANSNMYKIVIMDEVHERSVETDQLAWELKELLKTDHGRRLVLMTATLTRQQIQEFRDYFNHPDILGNCPVVWVTAEHYPLEVHYLKDDLQYNQLNRRLVDTIAFCHATRGPGAILAHLPGENTIHKAEKRLEEYAFWVGENDDDDMKGALGNLVSYRVYGQMRAEEQDAAVALTPWDKKAETGTQEFPAIYPLPGNPLPRRVLLSTPITQTSLTIPNLRFELDSGLQKELYYEPIDDISRLVMKFATQADIRQREGRPRREAGGVAYKLYSENQYNTLALPASQPRMRMEDVTDVIFEQFRRGRTDMNWDFLAGPSPQAVARALRILKSVGVMNEDDTLCGTVADWNNKARLPFSVLAINAMDIAKRNNCLPDMIIIQAMIASGNTPFIRPEPKLRGDAELAFERFKSDTGDHLTLLNLYQAYFTQESLQPDEAKEWCRIHFVHQHVLMEARRKAQRAFKFYGEPYQLGGLDETNSDVVRFCLASAYPHHIAKYDPNLYNYRLPFCSIRPKPYRFPDMRDQFLVYQIVLEIDKPYLINVSVAESGWLPEIPGYAPYENSYERGVFLPPDPTGKGKAPAV